MVSSSGSRVPRVSVLMTTYNGARFLAESIDSVLGQSFTDFELVVVDDASTDATASILAGYADARLRVIRNPVNLGVVGARNGGFAALRGAYVATIDHDDLWLESRLADGVAALDRDPDLLLVATQTFDLARGRQTVSDRPAAPSPLMFRWMLLMDCAVIYSSLLFRRDAATRADGTFLRDALRYADDYELMLRLAFAGKAIVLSTPLTVYREHDTNTTRQVSAEMHRNAVAARAEQIARWFGGDAAEAAGLIARHVGQRWAVTERVTLRRLGAVLRHLIDGFVAEYRADAADRARIEAYAQQVYWRAGRGGIRSGYLELAPAVCRRQSLSIAARRSDIAVSLAAGVLRLPRRVIAR